MMINSQVRYCGCSRKSMDCRLVDLAPSGSSLTHLGAFPD